MHYLSFRQLRQKLGGRSRSSCYRDVALGRLPKPLKIGSCLYWVEAEVDASLDRLKAANPHNQPESSV